MDTLLVRRAKRAHGTSAEFFEDPQGLFGKHLHPQAATLSEITPDNGLLVLCGEPGLGKNDGAGTSA